MKILIGNTGLVGKNLKDQQKFDYEFNSKNIQNIEDCPDYCDLYLSCLPATKWIVNKNIEKDLENILNIFSNIKKKKYNKIYLFSTIDVYSNSPLQVNEDYSPNLVSFNYGSNRLLFENVVKQLIVYKKIYIVRLPALFGSYLKKNIIFDLLNKNEINNININSYYQWYYLKNLTKDIEKLILLNENSTIFNLFTEPIYTEELINKIFPDLILNKKNEFVVYDYKTKFSSSGYLYSKEDTLKNIKDFVYEIRNK